MFNVGFYQWVGLNLDTGGDHYYVFIPGAKAGYPNQLWVLHPFNALLPNGVRKIWWSFDLVMGKFGDVETTGFVESTPERVVHLFNVERGCDLENPVTD